MSNRTNRGAGRTARAKSRDPLSARARSRQPHAGRVNSPADYPVRVKSHDGYIECLSSVLARMSEDSSGSTPAATRLHLKLEIGGSLIGKGLAMNYGQADSGGAPGSMGVLIGKREPSRLLIVSYRPMGSWPPGDEDRSLSEQWERSFGGLVARVRWDPKVSGLEPVGWYRAQPQASLSLSRRDLALFNRFFPEPWQIGLVLKSGESSTAGRIFLREPDRTLRPETGFQDFVVLREADRPRVYVGPASKAPAKSSWPQSADAGERQRRSSSQFLWPASALLAACGLVGGVWWSLRPANLAPKAVSSVQSAAPTVKEEAAQKADALWQQWQKEAGESQSSLQPPSDSDSTAPPADASVDTPSQGGSVASLSDHPDSNAQPPAVKESAAAQPPTASERRTPPRQPAPPTRAGSSRPSQGSPASRAGIIADVTPRAAERFTPLTFSNEPHPQAQIASPPPVAPPRTQSAPVITPPAPVRSIPQPSSTAPASVSHPPASPTATASVRRTPAATPSVSQAPSSGRLIWTGRLKKNELLVFNAGKPSVGSSTGSLPGKPVTISISPGDLTRNGIVIYSAVKPRPGTVQEAPGPENGWNKTVRDWDPNRATDVEVVEAPGPSNGWKRLVLRSKKSRDSVIMVEWKTEF